MEPDPGSLAEYLDHWYADMTVSPAKDKIQQRHLGLPPRLLSTSALGVLREHCATVGRNPAQVTVTYKATMAAESREWARAAWDQWGRRAVSASRPPRPARSSANPTRSRT
jgi:hypothetical protein